MRFVLSFAAIVPLLAASFASATTFFVSPCGQDTWAGLQQSCAGPLGFKRTIQAAIVAASDGDTIIVLPGTYVGTINFLGKDIRVVSSGGRDVTTIDGNGVGPVVRCTSGEGPGAILEGFTITGGVTAGSGAGMLNSFSSPTIIGCRFDGNFAAVNGGGMSNFAASPTIVDTILTGNGAGWIDGKPTSNGSGGAISAIGGSVTLEDCLLNFNCATVAGGAIATANGTSLEIVDSTILQNCGLASEGGVAGAIRMIGGSLSMSGSEVRLNTANGSPSIELNAVLDASFVACDFIDNYAFSNGVGGAVRTIGSTADFFACSFVSNSALSGGAVSIEGGETSFVFCGFVENLASEPGVGEGGAIRAVDAIVSIGLSNFSGNVASQLGGAVFARESFFEINGGLFAGNETNGFGGAIYLGEGALLDAGGPTIEGGEAFFGGGIAAGQGSALRVENATIRDNSGGFGGGLSVAGIGAVVGSTIELNTGIQGGGAIVYGAGTLRIANSRVRANAVSDSGAALFVDSEAQLVNCLVHGNFAPFGTGAIATWFDGSSLAVANSVLHGNNGGGIYNPGASNVVKVVNSILSNPLDEGGQFIGAAPQVTYSIVQGGFSGFGVIDAVPGFFNPAAGDFRLLPGSPAIDAGSNAGVPEDALDLDGDGNLLESVPIDFAGAPRFRDASDTSPFECAGIATVDIGAHEAAGDATPPPAISDLDGDGWVTNADLAILLGAWGPCAVGCCEADLDADGIVDSADLAVLLGAWSV
jgi:hypothetical protein